MKKKIYQYVMLLVSIVMLMSVVVPHHHHSNGLPCYKSLSAEAAHGGHGSSESHDCGCNGHNIALYTSIFSHVTDGNVEYEERKAILSNPNGLFLAFHSGSHNTA